MQIPKKINIRLSNSEISESSLKKLIDDGYATIVSESELKKSGDDDLSEFKNFNLIKANPNPYAFNKTLSENIFVKIDTENILEKGYGGKKAVSGEVRSWGGKSYIKNSDGKWKLYKHSEHGPSVASSDKGELTSEHKRVLNALAVDKIEINSDKDKNLPILNSLKERGLVTMEEAGNTKIFSAKDYKGDTSNEFTSNEFTSNEFTSKKKIISLKGTKKYSGEEKAGILSYLKDHDSYKHKPEYDNFEHIHTKGTGDRIDEAFVSNNGKERRRIFVNPVLKEEKKLQKGILDKTFKPGYGPGPNAQS